MVLSKTPKIPCIQTWPKCSTLIRGGFFWTDGNGCRKVKAVDDGRQISTSGAAAFGDKWRVDQVRRRRTARHCTARHQRPRRVDDADSSICPMTRAPEDIDRGRANRPNTCPSPGARMTPRTPACHSNRARRLKRLWVTVSCGHNEQLRGGIRTLGFPANRQIPMADTVP